MSTVGKQLQEMHRMNKKIQETGLSLNESKVQAAQNTLANCLAAVRAAALHYFRAANMLVLDDHRYVTFMRCALFWGLRCGCFTWAESFRMRQWIRASEAASRPIFGIMLKDTLKIEREEIKDAFTLAEQIRVEMRACYASTQEADDELYSMPAFHFKFPLIAAFSLG